MFKIQKLDFLISLYIFCVLVSELMGGKTFPLFSIGTFKINASVAIFLIPIIYSVNDIITEVYGKERTRSIIRSGLVMIVLVLLFTVLATALPPSARFITKEGAYDAIFQTSTRFAFASLTAFAIAEFLDVYVYAQIRERFGKKRLWLRNNASNFISQFIDTVLFYILAFFALDKSFNDNFMFIASLVPVYWLLKCFMSIIETPFVYIGVTWLRQDKSSSKA